VKVRALLVAVLLVCASQAHAQVFSPGVLSKAHKDLEGLANCTKCHVEAGRHDNARCNECHKEIGRRQGRGEGYHARVKNQQCAECHREHKGLSASIIDWGGTKRAFNHALTGWPLQGAHKKPDCKTCHEARRFVDDDARTLAKKGRETQLGLAKVCSSCHFDEHRGQEGDRCEKCHGAESFKKAPAFSHNKMSSFALTGRHRDVACTKCHQAVTDSETPAGAFPAPKDRSYLQFTDIPHASCTACHDDNHRGQFGRNCTQCHSTEGWKVIKQTAEDHGFHDKTDFPLRGMHTSVACKSCHGPFPGERAKFKGLAHGRCADCHMDAHVGQLKPEESAAAPKCDRCHTVTGFLPVSYDASAHQQARFALEGSHQAVACTLCHKKDGRLDKKVPASVRKELNRKKRALLVSETKLALPDVTGRCEGCHTDPHAGQFEARIKDTGPRGGCQACHSASAFADLRFSHDDSRFPLSGKHAGVACASCHAPDASATGKQRDVVVYRPLALACASCHDDAHLGQLAKDGVTACDRCHAADGFVPARFNHNDTAQSRFVLEGKHAELKCDACHPRVSLEGKLVARYKPLATDCAGCHADEHGGRFDEFAP
jgi:Cytochrome c7 and related cytochrome c